MNLNKIKNDYNEFGYVIINKLIDKETISGYNKYFLKNKDLDIWKSPPEVVKQIPLLKYRWQVFRDDDYIKNFLYNINIIEIVQCLLEIENPNLFLSIIPWESYGQDWHCDGSDADTELFGVKINPTSNFKGRVGAWISLGDIVFESGPFAFIPKSHMIDYHNDDLYLSLKEKYEKEILKDQNFLYKNPIIDSSIKTEPPNAFAVDELSIKYSRFINDIYVPALLKNGFTQETFLPQTGDVLFWGPKLLHMAHRSTEGFLRPSIIGHYNQDYLL